jgi:hypothetical protein
MIWLSSRESGRLNYHEQADLAQKPPTRYMQMAAMYTLEVHSARDNSAALQCLKG